MLYKESIIFNQSRKNKNYKRGFRNRLDNNLEKDSINYTLRKSVIFDID
jgi:hypothetical protein